MIEIRIGLVLGALLALTLAGASASANDDSSRGRLSGGIKHEMPGWFKQSFLEIADDTDEAGAAGKHVILFFSLEECPYCDRMLEESFRPEARARYIRQHFDTIAINVRGAREVAFNDEIRVSEKQLAEILKVRATPAILFLDADNRAVARIDGYRAPARFREVLDYVASRAYQNASLADYLDARLDQSVYRLRASELFTDLRDLSSVDGPLMLVLEDGSCYDCAEFHDGVLAHPDVRAEIAAYTVVRLDAASDAPIVGVDGDATTARQLARQYDMIYRPGVLLFDDGALIARSDSLIYPFHFKEMLRYVAGGYYREIDQRSYSRQRREELLEAGVDIYLGPPEQPTDN